MYPRHCPFPFSYFHHRQCFRKRVQQRTRPPQIHSNINTGREKKHHPKEPTYVCTFRPIKTDFDSSLFLAPLLPPSLSLPSAPVFISQLFSLLRCCVFGARIRRRPPPPPLFPENKFACPLQECCLPLKTALCARTDLNSSPPYSERSQAALSHLPVPGPVFGDVP